MIELPDDIIANIVYYLLKQQTDEFDNNSNSDSPSRSLAHYATISRSWQAPVEAKTFAHITLTPARVASPLAAQALSFNRMHRFVRSVNVVVVLPPYSKDARTRREDHEEKLANNKVFTGLIQNVFSLLSTQFPGAEQQLDHGINLKAYRPKIKLSIEAVCTSDEEDWKERQHRHEIGTHGQDIFEARYQSSYLDFGPPAGNTAWDEGEALPKLTCILELEVHASSCVANRMSSGGRLFAPRALCLIASKMSGLRSIIWELSDNEKRDFKLRKMLRTEEVDFAKALARIPSSLERFNLIYGRQAPLNHSYQPTSIVDETDEHGDKLSVALRNLSQRLSYFTLIADVGNELFWPLATEQHGDNDQPRWPSMRQYDILVGPLTPSGEWRHQRPADYPEYDDEGSLDTMQRYEAGIAAPGDDIEDGFREELDRDAAGQLLLGAARAAVWMPNLSNMTISFDTVTGLGDLDVGYWSRTRGGARSVELCVESFPTYQPQEDALRHWKEAARVNAGAELKVVIKESGRKPATYEV